MELELELKLSCVHVSIYIRMVQFKSESTPLRYALEDQADNGVKKELDLQFDSNFPENSELLLFVAPRCAAIFSELMCTPISKAQLSITTRLVNSQANIDGFYETEADEDDYKKVKNVIINVYQHKHITVVALPACDYTESAVVGRRLVDKLTPQIFVIASAAQSFAMDPVTYISNHQITRTPIAANLAQQHALKKAEPPTIVQGVGAACVSRAQQLNIPLLALLVTSDGPCNFEAITETNQQILKNTVFKTLGLAAPGNVSHDLSLLYV